MENLILENTVFDLWTQTTSGHYFSKQNFRGIVLYYKLSRILHKQHNTSVSPPETQKIKPHEYIYWLSEWTECE